MLHASKARGRSYFSEYARGAKMYVQVVLFGDSLTQQSFSVEARGWGAQLADYCPRKADFLNRGFSGYNTDWARLILPRLVKKEALPDVIVLFFGANDSALLELNSHQHVPVDRYQRNLAAMCDYLLEIGMAKSAILLVTPPPVHEEMWLEHNHDETWVRSDRQNSVTRLYAEAVEELGRGKDLDVQLFKELEDKDLRKYLSDGLHFSEAGNLVMASLLKPFLEKRLEGREEVFPNWKEASVEVLGQL